MYQYQAPTQWELDNIRGPRPGSEALLTVLKDHYAGSKSLGIYCRRRIGGRSCNEPVRLTPQNASNHSVGRGIDWAPANKAQGDDAFVRMIAAAKAGLPVCELIWYRQRWTSSRGVVPYKGDSPHTDHIHITITTDLACCPNTSASRLSIHGMIFGL